MSDGEGCLGVKKCLMCGNDGCGISVFVATKIQVSFQGSK